MTHNLTWPSLTVQWMPDITRLCVMYYKLLMYFSVRLEDKDYSTQRIIIGTQAEDEQNYLLIASITVPNEYKNFESKHYDAEKEGRCIYCLQF